MTFLNSDHQPSWFARDFLGLGTEGLVFKEKPSVPDKPGYLVTLASGTPAKMLQKNMCAFLNITIRESMHCLMKQSKYVRVKKSNRIKRTTLPQPSEETLYLSMRTPFCWNRSEPLNLI